MNSLLRAMIPVILLTATIGLYAYDNNTETVNTSKSPASAIVSTTAAELITVIRAPDSCHSTGTNCQRSLHDAG